MRKIFYVYSAVSVVLVFIVIAEYRLEPFQRLPWLNPIDGDSCDNQRKLLGPLKVNLMPPPLTKMAEELPELQMGGYFVPNCSYSELVAIIVPCRDRQANLEVLLYNLHPMLQRQRIAYQFFVLDQVGGKLFNKASLLNVGFLEVMKIRNFSCVIFNDADHIPENDLNLYDCPPPHSARHLAVAVDEFKYTLLYEIMFGGASALTRDQFILVNGMSNRFWGWGGEDDDMYLRIRFNGLDVERRDVSIARYMKLQHPRAPINPNRIEFVRTGSQFYRTDGLSNLNYTLVEVTTTPLYTLIKASFPLTAESNLTEAKLFEEEEKARFSKPLGPNPDMIKVTTM